VLGGECGVSVEEEPERPGSADFEVLDDHPEEDFELIKNTKSTTIDFYSKDNNLAVAET
jgi:hypothetical protein